jgi:hypothetical protein
MRTPGLFTVFAAALISAGCGYHVGTQTPALPKDIKTIAVPAFGNGTARQRLPRLLTSDVTHELISRTRYRIVANPDEADAVLYGTLANVVAFSTIFDPQTNRATGAQIIVTVSLTLTDRHTGKVVFTRPAFEVRERYEISTDPQSYFDESGTAMERVSRDVARSVVSAILEAF